MWECTKLGIFYQLGDDEQHLLVDWPKAVHFLEPACTAKVPEACAALIVIFESGGRGIAKDTARAAALVQQLCADGWDHYCTRNQPAEPKPDRDNPCGGM